MSSYSIEKRRIRFKKSTLIDIERNGNRTAICQSVSEISLTGVAPLEAESHIFIFLNFQYRLGSNPIKDQVKLTNCRCGIYTIYQKGGEITIIAG